MKHGMRNAAALLAFLTFAAGSALTVGAQTTIKPSDLRDPRPVYTPHSATYGATWGLITADVDRFMAPLDFGALTAQNWFAYGGVDENIKEGISFGFGTRTGPDKQGYFGIAYSGNLINEVIDLFNNESAVGFKMSTLESGGSTGSTLVKADGSPVPSGDYLSNHNLHFLLGGGVFGFKFGFAEYIKGSVGSAVDLESSLQPSFELGLNTGGFKFALRAAADFHQYEDNNSPSTKVNFLEPSGGITIGLNFSKAENTLAELDLIADGIYRMYGFLGDKPSVGGVDASSITDLRIEGSLGFTYRTELNEQFTLGFNGKIGGGFDLFTLSEKAPGGDSTYTGINVTPDVSVGVTYSPWKDHIALHGGLGLQLFSIDMITTDSSGSDVIGTAVAVPAVRLAIGTTFNFTENTALDVLIAAKDIAELTNMNFTMLFTVKK